jgi:hypothetical protein
MLLMTLAWNGISAATGFDGDFVYRQDGETLLLRLVQRADGVLSGQMQTDGVAYNLAGRSAGNVAEGTLVGGGESLRFSAMIADDRLELALVAAESASGYPAMPVVLTLERVAAGTPSSDPADSPAGSSVGDVVINGVALGQAQVDALAAQYGTTPLPGRYWYDHSSGLYGVVGYQAFGFMLPGHDFGTLDARASAGDSGVFVNGRQLPQAEWLVWSQLLEYMIAPGRYWLDAEGNAGYEGNPVATENLYLAAQRRARAGAYTNDNGSSDTWSSRFSAGGYDSGGQRGYVSVPGYGPVGYGF